MTRSADTAALIVGRLTDTRGVTLRQAVVTAVVANTCTIKLGGSDVAVAGVRHLASYTPVAADVVFVLQDATDLLILGDLA